MSKALRVSADICVQFVFATNFGPSSLVASSYAVSLAEECATRLALVHILRKRQIAEFGANENVFEWERRLEALIPSDAKLWCDPTFVVEHGEAWKKNIEVAEQKQADLIVMGAYTSEGMPGAATHLPLATVHKVITHAHCPVLTVLNRTKTDLPH
jgi:nucleotide-binding universal stress UspA family protein